MRRFALVAKDGTVDNVVLWDGTPYSPPVFDDDTGRVIEPAQGWDPPEGLTLVALDDDHPAGPGDQLDIATAEVTARAQPAEAEPTVEDRLAALEAQQGKG